jgi:hypothetical protein
VQQLTEAFLRVHFLLPVMERDKVQQREPLESR